VKYRDFVKLVLDGVDLTTPEPEEITTTTEDGETTTELVEPSPSTTPAERILEALTVHGVVDSRTLDEVGRAEEIRVVGSAADPVLRWAGSGLYF